MDSASKIVPKVLSELQHRRESMPDLSVTLNCEWCRERPVNDGSKLCVECHVCAECNIPGGVLFKFGSRLLCDSCNTKAKDKLAVDREARETKFRMEGAGFYKAHEKITMEALEERQRNIAIEYLSYPFGNLIISGGSGSGKTWTANAALKTLIERGNTGRWLSVPWMFASIRDRIGSEGLQITAYVKSILDFDYIVLDDLGAHRATDWAIETLYLILDQWESNDKRGMIVTTNLSMDEIAANFSDRIASRLAAACRMMKLDGTDKRIKK